MISYFVMISQKKLREAILLFVYLHEMGGDVSSDECYQLIMRELEISKVNLMFAMEKALKVIELISDIDNKIKKVSKEYDIERISKVDISILRLAFFERFEQGFDVGIVIQEAIRLAKKFSTTSSSTYVHAIIDEANKDINLQVTIV